ncbi:MAG TPA: 2-polyprenyl-3-methyl-6-methoxy-1,4-benzoquinone monooxygenase [Gammaproteobacteria bacterium]|nr:2-polyprenyl-3-methyl-6-methoxy-1,4-benzoquinone monooxygenase [Gammaproteobacteria bacterium]
MTERRLTPLDRILSEFEHALRTSFASSAHAAQRPNPATAVKEGELSEAERIEAGRLMRVNHAGEIAAQALYQGQAFMARSSHVREAMDESAAEEVDHLAWCEQRLQELGTPASALDPLWYLGSFAIGAAAGLLGDKESLGFIGETEKQVVQHLEGHMARLPAQDQKSRAILEQMKTDEALHGAKAERAGGASLPAPVRLFMRLTSKVMTETAYWI